MLPNGITTYAPAMFIFLTLMEIMLFLKAQVLLKNLTLGYTLPINKKFLNKVRVYVTGENLFYWSPLKKYCKTVDPELAITSSTYQSNSGLGYGYSKSFSVGLDVTF